MTKSEELALLAEEFSQKDKQFDNEFREFEEREKNEAIQKGREDGTQNTPFEELDSLSPVEQGIINAFQAKVDTYEGIVRPYLTQLRDKFLVNFQRRLSDLDNDDPTNEILNLRKERNNKIEEAKKQRDAKLKAIDNKSSFVNTKENYHDLRAKFENIKLKLNRSYTDSKVPFSLYAIIFTIVAIGEIFVNFKVFEIFGETRLLTWFSVITVGLILAFTSHGIGKILKKYSYLNKLVWVYLIIFISCMGLMAYSISNLRSYFIENNVISDQLVVQSSWLLFVALSFIFFFTGVLFSWLYYDSSDEFTYTKIDFDIAKQKYESELKSIDALKEKIHHEYQNERKSIEDHYAGRLYNVEDEDEILKNLIQITVSEYNAILHEAQATEKMINSALKETISDYRNENKRVRPKDKIPKIWQKQPMLNLHFQNDLMASSIFNNKLNVN